MKDIFARQPENEKKTKFAPLIAKNGPPDVRGCILALIGEDNSKNYCVCTQDEEPKQKLRRIGSVPIISIHSGYLTVEKPVKKTIEEAQRRERAKIMVMSERERKILLERREKNNKGPLGIKRKRPKIKKKPMDPLSVTQTTNSIKCNFPMHREIASTPPIPAR
eukprot:m.189788 g.189788  ORF g.189788 m.189788 type:complete len:164 (-) comp25675_c0_seq1:876-1367(-)